MNKKFKLNYKLEKGCDFRTVSKFISLVALCFLGCGSVSFIETKLNAADVALIDASGDLAPITNSDGTSESFEEYSNRMISRGYHVNLNDYHGAVCTQGFDIGDGKILSSKTEVLNAISPLAHKIENWSHMSDDFSGIKLIVATKDTANGSKLIRGNAFPSDFNDFVKIAKGQEYAIRIFTDLFNNNLISKDFDTSSMSHIMKDLDSATGIPNMVLNLFNSSNYRVNNIVEDDDPSITTVGKSIAQIKRENPTLTDAQVNQLIGNIHKSEFIESVNYYNGVIKVLNNFIDANNLGIQHFTAPKITLNSGHTYDVSTLSGEEIYDKYLKEVSGFRNYFVVDDKGASVIPTPFHTRQEAEAFIQSHKNSGSFTGGVGSAHFELRDSSGNVINSDISGAKQDIDSLVSNVKSAPLNSGKHVVYLVNGDKTHIYASLAEANAAKDALDKINSDKYNALLAKYNEDMNTYEARKNAQQAALAQWNIANAKYQNDLTEYYRLKADYDSKMQQYNEEVEKLNQANHDTGLHLSDVTLVDNHNYELYDATNTHLISSSSAQKNNIEAQLQFYIGHHSESSGGSVDGVSHSTSNSYYYINDSRNELGLSSVDLSRHFASEQELKDFLSHNLFIHGSKTNAVPSIAKPQITAPILPAQIGQQPSEVLPPVKPTQVVSSNHVDTFEVVNFDSLVSSGGISDYKIEESTASGGPFLLVNGKDLKSMVDGVYSNNNINLPPIANQGHLVEPTADELKSYIPTRNDIYEVVNSSQLKDHFDSYTYKNQSAPTLSELVDKLIQSGDIKSTHICTTPTAKIYKMGDKVPATPLSPTPSNQVPPILYNIPSLRTDIVPVKPQDKIDTPVDKVIVIPPLPKHLEPEKPQIMVPPILQKIPSLRTDLVPTMPKQEIPPKREVVVPPVLQKVPTLRTDLVPTMPKQEIPPKREVVVPPVLQKVPSLRTIDKDVTTSIPNSNSKKITTKPTKNVNIQTTISSLHNKSSRITEISSVRGSISMDNNLYILCTSIIISGIGLIGFKNKK